MLEGLRAAFPIVERLLEYRQLTKLKSTYIDALPELVNPADGRGFTPASTRRAPPPAAFPQPTPIYRTSRCAASWAGDPAGLHRPARFACCSAVTTPRSTSAPWPICRRTKALVSAFSKRRGHPRRHRRPALQRGAQRGHARYAAPGQDGKLRRDIRHERLRAGAGHRVLARGGRQASSTPILKSIPGS